MPQMADLLEGTASLAAAPTQAPIIAFPDPSAYSPLQPSGRPPHPVQFGAAPCPHLRKIRERNKWHAENDFQFELGSVVGSRLCNGGPRDLVRH